MWRLASLTGLVAVAATVSGAEFPLESKNLTGMEAMSSAGGYAAFAQPTAIKPGGVKKEPAAVSARPLYGQLQIRGGQGQILFRLDESQGNGKGYDALILDLNQNGDLTDDPVGTPATEPNANRTQAGGFEQKLFGPIQAAADRAVGIWRPSYYAHVYIFNRQAVGNAISGQVLLRAANYLQANIDIGGVRERIGLMDANCDGRLGEPAKSQSLMNAGALYFFPQDVVLRDRNGNGRFDSDRFETESEAFAKVMYFGTNPYAITLAPDLKWIRLEQFEGPLGELAVQPHGDQIRRITLAHEVSSGHWEQFNPVFVQGKAKVPPGNYQLYSCQLAAQDKNGDQITAGAYLRERRSPIKVEEGKTAILRCGGPLELQVTAEKQNANGTSGLMGAAISLFSGGSSAGSELRINMTALGAGGEAYSGYTKGNDSREMPKPAFKVLGVDGKQLASGNLEFG
jgi:hypothetical protein